MSLEGKQLGRYQLRRLLGSGGMGEVYLGENPRISQQVAIKVIRAEVLSSAGTQEMARATRLFEREATAIARLDHPHVLSLNDFGEATIDGANITYLVTPFRPEGSFADWLQRRSSGEPLPLEDVAYFLAQMAEALQYIHDHQIIHRDVKPSNFLIRENKERPSRPDLLLADFGVAQIMGMTTVSHTHPGTPNYMAPEQWEGYPVPATDQYALGIIAYELLTNQFVFQGSTQQVMYHHLHTQPPPPSQINHHLPSSVDAVLTRALAKRPEERYPSVSAFAQAFRQALIGQAAPLGTDQQKGANPPATPSGGVIPVYQVPPEASVSPGSTPDSEQATRTVRSSDESLSSLDLRGIGQPLPPTAPVYLGPTPAQPTPPPPRQAETPPEGPKLEQPDAPFTTGAAPITPALTPSAQEPHPSRPSTPSEPLPLPPGGRDRRPDWMRRLSPPLAVALVSLAVLIVGGIVLAAVLLSRPGSPSAPRAWQTVINDPLSDNSKGNEWEVGNNCQFTNDAYYDLIDQKNTYNSCTSKRSFGDFSFQVSMIIKEGDCGGIVFRYNPDSHQGYFFQVCQDGTYAFYRTDGRTQPIIPAKISSFINNGLSQENTLRVKAEGSQISLFINGQPVGTAKNEVYSQGVVGVVARAGQIVPTVVGYTNAKVDVPPK